MNKLISALFRFARLLIDIKAFISFNPKKISNRFANKYIGKNITRKMYFKSSKKRKVG